MEICTFFPQKDDNGLTKSIGRCVWVWGCGGWKTLSAMGYVRPTTAPAGRLRDRLSPVLISNSIPPVILLRKTSHWPLWMRRMSNRSHSLRILLVLPSRQLRRVVGRGARVQKYLVQKGKGPTASERVLSVAGIETWQLKICIFLFYDWLTKLTVFSLNFPDICRNL